MSGDCERRIFPGPRRNVLTCCSRFHVPSVRGRRSPGPGRARPSMWVMVVIRAMTSFFPSPSRSGTTYSTTRTRRAFPAPGPRRRGPRRGASAVRLPLILGLTSTMCRSRRVGTPAAQGQVRFDPPQQRGPGVRGRAPVLPVIEVPVRDQQPVLLQPRVQLPRQRLLAAALGHARADRRQHRGVRRALADRPALALGNAARVPSFPAPGYPNSAAFAFVSGTSHSRPSMLIFRHGPRNAPSVSSVATGTRDLPNGLLHRRGPSLCRAWVIPPVVIVSPARHPSSPSPQAFA